MADENPPCSGMDMTSVTCPPAATISVPDAGLSEKSGGGLKVAVSLCWAVRVKPQVLGTSHVHAPVQLPKVDPPVGAATKETGVPGKYSEEQVPPVSLHPMEPSPAVTVPVPPPAILTVSVAPSTKFAMTAMFAVIVTAHDALPEHAPPQL